MTTEENIRIYEDFRYRISAYQMASTIIYADKLSAAPTGGAEYRDARTSFLEGEAFALEHDPERLRAIRELKDDPGLTEEMRRAIYLEWREIERSESIPREVFENHQRLMSASYRTWLEAKEADDYTLFAPMLNKVIEECRSYTGYRRSELPLYDRMLDDYEEGMTQEKYDAFFAALKERLLPLIAKVRAAGKIDDSFLTCSYPVRQQRLYMEHILRYIGFDHTWGNLTETEHPFTCGVCSSDLRITTKYLENNAASAIFSTVHEGGHAWYEHNVLPEYSGTVFVSAISSAMHESESRLCENYLARSQAFWDANFPALGELFPEQLAGVSAEDFCRAVNAVTEQPVRTEADELTYPIHILIRYELEKGLFDGSIRAEDLRELWNQKYRDYLGLEIQHDRDGILQDVHWAEGLFGYFPTYALGSAFAAQFMHEMRSQIDVDALLSGGRWDLIMQWLRDSFQKYGARYRSDEILRMVTGEDFDVTYYLDYLEEKYTKLYEL